MNSLTKFEIFYQSDQPVQRISVEVHYLSRFEFKEPELALVISPLSELGITCHFFQLLLILQEIFYQIFNFFLNGLDRLETGSAGSLSQLVWSTYFGDF